MKHKTIKLVGVMRKVPISGFKHLPHNINKMGAKSQQWEQKKNYRENNPLRNANHNYIPKKMTFKATNTDEGRHI